MILDFSYGNPAIARFILQTVSQSAVLVLQSLELLDLHVDTLADLGPLFSVPEGYSGLKELSAKLSWPVAPVHVVQYPLFALIVAHQTTLESLELSQLGHFPEDSKGEMFVLALISLLGQPDTKTMLV